MPTKAQLFAIAITILPSLACGSKGGLKTDGVTLAEFAHEVQVAMLAQAGDKVPAGAKVIATELSLAAVRSDIPEGDPRVSHLLGMIGFFSDGTSRWMQFQRSTGKPYETATPHLATAAPVVANGVDDMITELSGAKCGDIELLSDAQIARFPDRLQGSLKLFTDLKGLCELMAGQGEGWKPAFENVTVFVDTPEGKGALTSPFSVKNGKLTMDYVLYHDLK